MLLDEIDYNSGNMGEQLSCDPNYGDDQSSTSGSLRSLRISRNNRHRSRNKLSVCRSDRSASISSGQISSGPSAEAEGRTLELLNCSGYPMTQVNGQRKLGPPPGWTKPPPDSSCEVFVGKIPRDIYEYAIYPIFQKIGEIYEIRLMMDFSGTNRGYCFVMFTEPESAQRAIKALNNYEIARDRRIGVVASINNCRLSVKLLPKNIEPEAVIKKIYELTEEVSKVSVYKTWSGQIRHALICYRTHRGAAMGRRRLLPERDNLFSGVQVNIDWAHPTETPTDVIEVSGVRDNDGEIQITKTSIGSPGPREKGSTRGNSQSGRRRSQSNRSGSIKLPEVASLANNTNRNLQNIPPSVAMGTPRKSYQPRRGNGRCVAEKRDINGNIAANPRAVPICGKSKLISPKSEVTPPQANNPEVINGTPKNLSYNLFDYYSMLEKNNPTGMQNRSEHDRLPSSNAAPQIGWVSNFIQTFDRYPVSSSSFNAKNIYPYVSDQGKSSNKAFFLVKPRKDEYKIFQRFVYELAKNHRDEENPFPCPSNGPSGKVNNATNPRAYVQGPNNQPHGTYFVGRGGEQQTIPTPDWGNYYFPGQHNNCYQVLGAPIEPNLQQQMDFPVFYNYQQTIVDNCQINNNVDAAVATANQHIVYQGAENQLHYLDKKICAYDCTYPSAPMHKQVLANRSNPSPRPILNQMSARIGEKF